MADGVSSWRVRSVRSAFSPVQSQPADKRSGDQVGVASLFATRCPMPIHGVSRSTLT
jgi:hypothetical protein